MSIIISPGKGVTVRAPYRTSMNVIERYVREKLPWIEKHTKEYSGLKRIDNIQFSDGELHLLLGRKLILRIIESDPIFVRLSDNYLEVGVKVKEDAVRIKSILEKWYRKKAQEIFSSRLMQILDKHQQYGFHPTGYKVRTLKSRWGSCNSKGKITLNAHLVKLDESYIDYVIIHELCHLKHHNHGKEFYKLLAELVPDYKFIRKELRKYLTG